MTTPPGVAFQALLHYVAEELARPKHVVVNPSEYERVREANEAREAADPAAQKVIVQRHPSVPAGQAFLMDPAILPVPPVRPVLTVVE